MTELLALVLTLPWLFVAVAFVWNAFVDEVF